MITRNQEYRIGVYVCHCGTNISHTVDIEAVAEYARGLPDVVVVREYKYMCSEPGQELIKQDIEEQNLSNVVVSSCSPLMHEETFRNACEDAGLNRFLFQMSNIREQCSWVHSDRDKATAKAKRLIAAAVRRVHFHKSLEQREAPVHPDALVVGAGIAGIEAALKIAESGKKVYLVEKEPSIGGHMAKFDKTFPTLDCAACILTPKMVQVGQHPNIELMTYSEIDDVSGYIGNFKVKVRRKARYVDEVKCTGCGDCVEVCPVEALDEFDEKMQNRRMIYRSFPQAVPNAFVIDKKGLPQCRSACPAGVHAQGYIQLIGSKKFKEAADLLWKDLPLPSVCGRVCYHPCEDSCSRGEVDEAVSICALKRFVADWAMINDSDVEPLPLTHKEKVAVVGSGPAGLACANELLQRGYPVTVFEADKKAGGMLRYAIPAYRLPDDILDYEIDRLCKLGIEIKTDSPVKSVEQLKANGYDAVFMSLGAAGAMEMGVPGEDLDGVMNMLEFLKQANTGKLSDIGGTVAVIGGGNSAMDAARAAQRVGAEKVMVVYRRSRAEMPAHDWEIQETKDEGVEFEFLAAPVRVEGDSGKAGKLICQRMELGEPDESGRRRPVPIKDSEFEISVSMVIPAIGQMVRPGGLEKELKLTDRGRIETDPITLATSLKGVFAGGDVVTGPASVVDAFGAGKEAAESIDRYIRKVDLAEGRDEEPLTAPTPDTKGVATQERVKERRISMSGVPRNFDEIVSVLTEDEAVAEAQRCLNCGGCSECMECVKKCEADAICHDQVDQIKEVDVGAIIVATGFQLFDSSQIAQYGYGKLDNVLSAMEFERMSHASGPTGGKIFTKDNKPPESVVILHCVGSRDENYNEYCSRVCCMYSLKFAHLVKEKTDAEVYNLYIDMRAFGKGYEEFYKRVMGEGVHFIRGKCAEVTNVAECPEEEGKLVAVVEDTLLGITRRLPADMVILSGGFVPGADADKLSKTIGLNCSQGGFFLEKHPKLAPVDSVSDGIFIAGACQGPKDIPDSVAQGAAAAAGVLSLIDKGKVIIEPITAEIDEERCAGCQLCVANCPYAAIEYDKEKKISVVTEELCKGCGTCVAGCPSGAAHQKNFEDEQIFSEIEGILA